MNAMLLQTMASTHENGLLRLDVRVNAKEPDEGVFQIISIVKPEWRREDVTKRPLGTGEGYMNVLFIYRDAKTDDSLVFRIFGEGFSEFMDRESELKAHLVFQEIGSAPKLYCVFKNGMCTAFLPGKTYNLAKNEGRELQLAKLCAKEMAKFHCQTTKNLAIEKYKITKDNRVDDSIDSLFEKWGSNVEALQALLSSEDFPSSDEVWHEFKEMRKLCHSLDMPYVFCHNDLHPGNAIHDVEKDSVKIIDYEFSSFNYSGFDLSLYLFYSAFGLGVNQSEEAPPLHSPDFTREFLRTYLDSLSVLDNWSREVSDDDVELLYVQIRKYMLYNMLMYVPFGVLLSEKPPDTGDDDTQPFYKGSLKCWRLYLKLKDEYLNGQPFPQVK